MIRYITEIMVLSIMKIILLKLKYKNVCCFVHGLKQNVRLKTAYIVKKHKGRGGSLSGADITINKDSP